jgi:hypothetical protein
MPKLQIIESLLRTTLDLLSQANEAQPAACVASDSVVRFMEDHCYEIPGTVTEFADFYWRYNAWSPAPLSKIALARRLRQLLPVGTLGANVLHLGNLTFNPNAKRDRPYRVVGGKLHQSQGHNHA